MFFINTILCFDFKPFSNIMLDCGILKCSESNFISALFAFPSIGGSVTYTINLLSFTEIILFSLALHFTLMNILINNSFKLMLNHRWSDVVKAFYVWHIKCNII